MTEKLESIIIFSHSNRFELICCSLHNVELFDDVWLASSYFINVRNSPLGWLIWLEMPIGCIFCNSTGIECLLLMIVFVLLFYFVVVAGKQTCFVSNIICCFIESNSHRYLPDSGIWTWPEIIKNTRFVFCSSLQ